MKRQRRVGTLSMGIMLIVLGIIMVLSQIYGNSVIGYAIKWWPIVFVLLGGEILLYNFFSRQDQPKVKFDVFSIIMISLLMLVSVGAYVVSSEKFNISFDAIFDVYTNETKYTKEYTVDVSDSEQLVVQNSLGDVKVIGCDGDKIEVDAYITIKNNDKSYADEIAESVVSITTGKTMKITSDTKKYSSKNKIGNITINYTIKVPNTVAVEVENKFGDVSFEELALAGKVENKNGDITVKSHDGDLIVDSSFGNIEVDSITGKVELYQKNGDIEAINCDKDVLAENSFGDIYISAVKGIVTITNQNGEITSSNVDGDAKVTNEFGDITLTDIKGSVDIYNTNGKITLTTIEMDVKVKNSFGDIHVSGANKAINIEDSNGDVTVETDKLIEQNVDITNKFGETVLKIPSDQTGYFEATTKFGEIHNDFAFQNIDETNNSSIKGTLENDSIKFNIKNDNGDIKIQKN